MQKKMDSLRCCGQKNTRNSINGNFNSLYSWFSLMFVWVSLMFTFVDCVLGGCACNWDSRCDCVSSMFKLFLTCWWAWNLQRRPFVMTLLNITGDGLDHSQNCLIPIHNSPMNLNLGFRCLPDRSSLDCRQRQKGCRAWETMQRLKIAQKYVSYFVYVRIINVLDIDISMAFVIISIPGKTCQFSPIFSTFFGRRIPTRVAEPSVDQRLCDQKICWHWWSKNQEGWKQATAEIPMVFDQQRPRDPVGRQMFVHRWIWRKILRQIVRIAWEFINLVEQWHFASQTLLRLWLDDLWMEEMNNVSLTLAIWNLLKPRHPSSQRWCHPADAQ